MIMVSNTSSWDTLYFTLIIQVALLRSRNENQHYILLVVKRRKTPEVHFKTAKQRNIIIILLPYRYNIIVTVFGLF